MEQNLSGILHSFRRYSVQQNCKTVHSELYYVLLKLFFIYYISSSSSSSSGPGAYAPDAPQPVGLLCYPLYYPTVLDVSTFATSPSPRPCNPRDP